MGIHCEHAVGFVKTQQCTNPLIQNLDDFHSTSSWSPISYLWVWIYALIGVAVFALDCFTAVNLLILDRWSSQIKPAIDFKISKWIFVGCIGMSFLLYAYEWVRAVRVMKRGGIAESYMDPLAVQIQCMRKKGWRRFLVFAALTKSKKGKDYVAFFVRFQFTGFWRIALAEGGRQFVNALTIISVTQANLVPIGAHAAKAGDSPVLQFFSNVATLWNTSQMEALVLFSMAFTLAIWVFSALSFIVALILYCFFLWHQIPQSDGRLSVYCRRKIDTRLAKIVEKKVQAGIEEAERKRAKEEARVAQKAAKAAAKGSPGGLPQKPAGPLLRQPTLPTFDTSDDDEKKVGFGLERMDTMATLPLYTSSPASRTASPAPYPNQAGLPQLRPPPATRQFTSMSSVSQYSDLSYASNASLLKNAGELGYDSPLESPVIGMQAMNRQMSNGSLNRAPLPPRSFTSNSNYSQPSAGRPPMQARGPPPPRSGSAFRPEIAERSPLSRAGSAMSDTNGYGPSATRSQVSDPWAFSDRPPVVPSMPSDSQSRQPSRQSFARPFNAQNKPSFSSSQSQQRISPVSSIPEDDGLISPSATSGYVAFNPYRAQTPSNNAPYRAQTPSSSSHMHDPSMMPAPLMRRNMTASPMEMRILDSQSARMSPVQRSATAPIEQRGMIGTPINGGSGSPRYHGPGNGGYV